MKKFKAQEYDMVILDESRYYCFRIRFEVEGTIDQCGWEYDERKVYGMFNDVHYFPVASA